MLIIRFADLGWPAVSPLISWWTKHWSNHCDLMTGPDTMISALPLFGVQEWPQRVVAAKRVEYITVPCTDEQARKAIAYARAQIGKPYDYGGVVSFPFRSSWRVQNRWFCSEITAAALEVAGVISVPKGVYRISPADLYRMLVEDHQ
jgi:uncharacterized protein YycO